MWTLIKKISIAATECTAAALINPKVTTQPSARLGQQLVILVGLPWCSQLLNSCPYALRHVCLAGLMKRGYGDRPAPSMAVLPDLKAMSI